MFSLIQSQNFSWPTALMQATLVCQTWRLNCLSAESESTRPPAAPSSTIWAASYCSSPSSVVGSSSAIATAVDKTHAKTNLHSHVLTDMNINLLEHATPLAFRHPCSKKSSSIFFSSIVSLFRTPTSCSSIRRANSSPSIRTRRCGTFSA